MFYEANKNYKDLFKNQTSLYVKLFVQMFITPACIPQCNLTCVIGCCTSSNKDFK